MGRGLTPHEAYLRRIDSMALSSVPVPDGLLAAAPAHHDGVMIALVPDDPEDLALSDENALPADDLHVTLCYFGTVKDMDSFARSKLLRGAQRVAGSIGHAFLTRADGVVVMGSNKEGVPATALLIQADEIVEMYDALVEELDYESKYPSFIPHMTTGYGVPFEDAQQLLGLPVQFSTLLVKFGDEKHNIALSAGLVAAPRSANVIDRVIDSLGRLWDEALHPRDGEGKFIKKNGAISGKLSVPTPDRKGVTTMDANRASVVGFHTFDNDVWVLAEVTNPDGSKVQGFARATDVKSTAPVKARLDALYPVEDNSPSSAAIERSRQIDLLLARINKEYLSNDDEEGAYAFLNALGLNDDDLDYMFGAEEDESVFGIRVIDHSLSSEELDEVDSIIDDARQVKKLRDRVHGLKDATSETHVAPRQRLLSDDTPENSDGTVEALQSGADPLSLNADRLIHAMDTSGRFSQPEITSVTGVSEIGWFVDDGDQTGTTAYLAGTGTSTTGRAYFVKKSAMGADVNNIDIVKEVLSSLINEQLEESLGDDNRLLPIPRSRFGENPVWDGGNAEDKGFNTSIHQPGFVVSSHAAYAVPSDWTMTSMADEETRLQNDIRRLDEFGQADATAAYQEDMGDIYGNSVAQMVLWDFITMNADRNPNNAILAAPRDGGEGKALPIDHGFAFADGVLADVYGVDPGSLDESTMFDLFMSEDLTQGWLAYVLGGLDLGDNVTEASIRRVLMDFVDSYGQMDVDTIVERFRGMPNVSGPQIAEVEAALAGVIARVNWLSNNIEQVLKRLTTR